MKHENHQTKFRSTLSRFSTRGSTFESKVKLKVWKTYHMITSESLQIIFNMDKGQLEFPDQL